MNQEHEAKFLNIDVATIEAKLAAIGAHKEGDYFYRSCSFDFPGFPLDEKKSWVRLRDEGNQVMLAYKKRLGVTGNTGNDTGMEEIEVKVDSYEQTALFLEKIGMIVKFAQEKKRTRWVKDELEFDIDTWPRLAPYLEIEALSEEGLQQGIALLGLDPKDGKRCSATQVYEMNGIRDKDYIKMTFDEFVKR